MPLPAVSVQAFVPIAVSPPSQDQAQPPLPRPVGETCESHLGSPLDWWGTDIGKGTKMAGLGFRTQFPRGGQAPGQELLPGTSVPTRTPPYPQLYTHLSSGPLFCSAGWAGAVESLLLQSLSGELQLALGYQGMEQNRIMTTSYPDLLYPPPSVQFSHQVIISCVLGSLRYFSAEPAFYRWINKTQRDLPKDTH